jgi:hypothetical protein
MLFRDDEALPLLTYIFVCLSLLLLKSQRSFVRNYKRHIEWVNPSIFPVMPAAFECFYKLAKSSFDGLNDICAAYNTYHNKFRVPSFPTL